MMAHAAATEPQRGTAVIDRVLRGIVVALVPLLMLVFFAPAESPFSLPKRALFVVISYALFLVAATFQRLGRIDRLSGFVLCAVPLATLLAWASSPRRDLAAQTVMMVCAGPLLAWVTASVRPRAHALLRAFAFSGFVESLVALSQWMFRFDLFALFDRASGESGRMRLYGTLGNPDFVSIFIAVTLPAALALTLQAVKLRRIFWICVLAIDVAALVGCGSRTGFAAAVIGCAVLLLFSGISRAKRLRSIFIVIALVAVVAAGVANRNPRTSASGLKGRLFTWRVALVGIAGQPAGSGPGTFAYRYPSQISNFFRTPRDNAWLPFIGYERTANNDFVQALAETGWTGLLALVCVFSFVCRRLAAEASRRAEYNLASAPAMLGLVAALATAALAESPLQRPETWAILWIAVGTALVCRTREPDLNPRSTPARMARVTIAVLVTGAISWFALLPVRASYESDLGGGYESQHRWQEAIAAYRRSIALDASASSAPFNLPRAIAQTGDFDTAASAAVDGMRWIDEPELYLLHIRILESRGAYVSAVQAAAAAVDRFPYSPELRDELAKLASSFNSR